MEITGKTLGQFKVWLLERGRVEGTADTYVTNLRSCATDPKGLTHRLVAGDLSPNTLRLNLAALRAWALYTENAPLAKRLADLRLPPARRMRTKMPLDMADLRRLVAHLQTCPMENEAVRQVLLIMAKRGFRSGDVLRIQREELVRALATGKLVYEGKGRKRTEFAIGPFRENLERLVAMGDWRRVRDLVTRSKDPKVASKRVWRTARRTARSVGIEDMNPHRYRHTFATRYLDRLQGDPNAIIKLQKYMGWESMATAARYVDKVSQNELDSIGADLADEITSPR